jgi:beta-lactamase regulating signal transducer with metallopeptidase domain
VRPLIGLALLVAAGIAVGCMLVGVGDGPACTAGMASAACLGSINSMREMLGVATGIGAIVSAILGVSIVRQVARHRQLAERLGEAARPARLADQDVGLVPGLAAPCVAGLARSRIYCPTDLGERLTEDEMRAVILHERHHQLVHAPARLILLASLMPALRCAPAGRRWVERQRAGIEIAADDHALTAGVGRPDLARALLKLGSAGPNSGLAGYASAAELRLRHLVGDASHDDHGSDSLALLVVPVTAVVACLVLGLIA